MEYSELSNFEKLFVRNWERLVFYPSGKLNSKKASEAFELYSEIFEFKILIGLEKVMIYYLMAMPSLTTNSYSNTKRLLDCITPKIMGIWLRLELYDICNRFEKERLLSPPLVVKPRVTWDEIGITQANAEILSYRINLVKGGKKIRLPRKRSRNCYV